MPSQALTPDRLFAFGKLPSHGDFVARGMSPSERVAWDAWITAGLDAARAQLADDFELRHDAAPVWRFIFPPAEFCWQGCAGILAASIDRAGRRFAIVLGVRLGDGDLDASAAEALTGSLEDALYWAYRAGGDVDALIARAAAGLSKASGPREPASGACRLWTVDPFSEIIAEAPVASLLARCLTGLEG